MGSPAGLHWLIQFFKSLLQIQISSHRVTEPQIQYIFCKKISTLLKILWNFQKQSEMSKGV